MKKKVIITESQLNKIVSYINETEQVTQITKLIADDLLMNYEPAIGTVNNGLEFEHHFIITKKVDGDRLSAGALFDYMTTKYKNVNDDFIKQVITDWYEGVLDGKNYQLSKPTKFM
jgi:hypothetical protein